jgi:hypothetical protein
LSAVQVMPAQAAKRTTVNVTILNECGAPRSISPASVIPTGVNSIPNEEAEGFRINLVQLL